MFIHMQKNWSVPHALHCTNIIWINLKLLGEYFVYSVISVETSPWVMESIIRKEMTDNELL